MQHHDEPKQDWTLVARLDAQNAAIQDYCLIRGGGANRKIGGVPQIPVKVTIATTPNTWSWVQSILL